MAADPDALGAILGVDTERMLAIVAALYERGWMLVPVEAAENARTEDLMRFGRHLLAPLSEEQRRVVLGRGLDPDWAPSDDEIRRLLEDT